MVNKRALLVYLGMPKCFTYILYFLVLTFSLLTSCKNENRNVQFDYNEVKQSCIGEEYGIVTAHPLATKVGEKILDAGGNAIDAAIGIQFALAVVYPRAGNLGGGGFATIRSQDGNMHCLDFREKAPELSTRDMYLDSLGNYISRLSLDGHLAVGVPGTVRGMYALKKKLGSPYPMDKILDEAIDLASSGFSISKTEAERLNKYADDLKKYNSNNCPLVKELNWKEGDILMQTKLAATLERIKVNGPDEFYKGETSKLIIKEMESGKGLISAEDLELYNSVWREPIVFDYKEFKISCMPLPSSGGVVLAQIFKMLDNYDLKTYEHNSVEYIHLLSEIERRAFADRANYLGDEDFFDVPIDSLLSEEYVDKKMIDFDENAASESDIFFIQSKEGNLESYETTHTSVIDKMGNAVSMTVTLNGNYGSKVMVEEAGFLLNNEMDDFSAKPGLANMFGLVGSKANEIAPAKRMLSSMSPCIVSQEGKVKLIVGSPGGSTIISSVLQTILNTLHFKYSIDESMGLPRFHHQGVPDRILVEKDRFNKEVLEDLRKKGHLIEEANRLGVVKAIQIEDKNIHAAGDPRNPDDHCLVK